MNFVNMRIKNPEKAFKTESTINQVYSSAVSLTKTLVE